MRAFAALALICFYSAALRGQDKVYRLSVDGVINPASAEFISKGIEKAGDENARCLIIELDTPGGLMKSMNLIVKAILSSECPIVVYVSPSGSHCASAGVFITMAAHVAAMAPGTNIGAAHPVNLGQGGADSSSLVMMEKITNDAVSFIRSLAEKNKRNPDWAEDAVRKSVSITESEALKHHVVDMVARNFDSLLVQLDSTVVETVMGKKIIRTRGAEVEVIQRGWRFALLDILTDPNIAYILMMLGIYGLFFELYNPGSVLPGVIGGICLILAFYSFQTLPINYAGLALILFGIILLLLEIKITSYGILSIGGVVSLFLGSLMLIDSPEQWMSISWGVIIPVVITTLVFFSFVVGLGLRAQTAPVRTGREGMVGAVGTVTDVAPDGLSGLISVHGEIWKANSRHTLHRNDRVRVVRVEDLTVTVESLIRPDL